MGTTYEKADKATIGLLVQVRDEHHGGRLDGVTVAVLLAHAPVDKNGDPTGPAVKVHGVPAVAKARIVALRDRADGMADAQIVLDGDRWGNLSREEKAAVLDHELTHLEWPTDGEGERKTDDLGRPKLKLRVHDHDYGWFDAVVRRHGRASQEVQQARRFADIAGQLYLAGFEGADAVSVGERYIEPTVEAAQQVRAGRQ